MDANDRDAEGIDCQYLDGFIAWMDSRTLIILSFGLPIQPLQHVFRHETKRGIHSTSRGWALVAPA